MFKKKQKQFHSDMFQQNQRNNVITYINRSHKNNKEVNGNNYAKKSSFSNKQSKRKEFVFPNHNNQIQDNIHLFNQPQNSKLKSSIYNKQNQNQHKINNKYSYNYPQYQNNDYQQQEQQPSQSELSSLSFTQYKDILSNLFLNGQNDEEWTQMPQVLKLIIKALSLSMNAIENKIVQNRQLINQTGIKNQQNNLKIETVNKQIKKLDSKIGHYIKLHEEEKEMNRKSNIKQIQNTQDIYTKGLDLIMIQQVKTITDALISKKNTQLFKQIQQLIQKSIKKTNNQSITQKISFFQDRIQTISKQIYQKQQKLQRNFKQRILLIQMEIEYLKKQFKQQKDTVCNMAEYIQQQYCLKSNVKEIIEGIMNNKSKIDETKDNILMNSQYRDTQYGNKNKIQEIVKECINKNLISNKQKQFKQCKQKILKDVSNFPTISEVQKIVLKAIKNQNQKIQQLNHRINQNLSLNKKQKYIDQNKQQDTKSMKQNKSLINLKDKSNSIIKNKITQTSKLKKSQIQKNQFSNISSKNSKHQHLNSHITTDIQPLSHKQSKKTHQQQKSNLVESQWEVDLNNSKIKQMIQNLKQQIDKKITSQIQTLNKKITKRLVTAQQQFCGIVQQNWKKMSQKQLSLAKTQKQNMQHLLSVFSALNVVVRYTTSVSCRKNQCIKWQKQIFNCIDKIYTVSSEKTHLYINAPGIYSINLVLYSRNNEYIDFYVELNSENIFKKEKMIKKNQQENQNQSNQIQKQIVNIKKQFNHPSLGVQFSQTLLIPTKSHLAIRLLQDGNFQGLLQIKKM